MRDNFNFTKAANENHPNSHRPHCVDTLPGGPAERRFPHYTSFLKNLFEKYRQIK
jgi:hypothetical protein